jgi:hypothetical protein
MKVRRAVVTLLAALVVGALTAGAAVVGHQQGRDDRPTPSSFAAEPLPAVSPSYPVTPARVVDDVRYPALEPGVALHPVRLGSPPFQVKVPVPRRWVRVDSQPGVWKWFPASDAMKNVYFIRVSQIAVNNATVPAAVNARITALDNASEVDDFVVEDQDADRFVSRYVADDHLRVSFEGYVARGPFAYLSIVVVGRDADREGLADLFERMMAGARTTVG